MANQLLQFPVSVTIPPKSTVAALDQALADSISTINTAIIAQTSVTPVSGNIIPGSITITRYQAYLDSGDNPFFTAQVQYQKYV